MLLAERRFVENRLVPDVLREGGYLAEATRYFPSDGRLALARVEGLEAIDTRCSTQYCHDEMTSAILKDLRSRAGAAPPDSDTSLRHIHDLAVLNLAAFERLVPAAAAFAAIASAHPEVRAEANAHIGYLAIRAGRPDAALAPLATAATSEDPYVRYLAEHLTGRALEALGRRSEAIAAYRRALAIAPHAPATATLLASQLFLSDDVVEREEANAVLRASMLVRPRPDDPWKFYWHGDARLWSTYMGRLRRALRQ